MNRLLPILFLSFFTLLANAQTVTITSTVTASGDDAEESEDGTDISQSSSDLEMVYDDGNQTVGIRFSEVKVPPNALIQNAYIQFTADEDGDEPTNLIIKGNKVAFSTSFIDATNEISGRPMTTAEVSWNNIPAWESNDAGLAQRTPDLSEIITEIITSNNWQQGNPIAIIISGTGERTADSYDGNALNALKLVITYEPTNDIDLGIGKLIQPDNFVFPAAAATINVEVINFGANPQSDFEVSYSINGGTPVTEMVSQMLSTGESFNHMFTQTADLSNLGNYQIEVEVSIPNDEIPVNNSLTKNISVVSEIGSLFFNSSSTWKYLDDGADQGTAWQELNFDDSAWRIGQGHFGFGDNDEDIILESGSATYYFRKKVNIPDVNALQDIYFNLVHDDAAVVHINGNEVIRTELMPAGTIDFETLATDVLSGGVENVFFQYILDKSLFQTGDNIIAVEVHNSSFTNVDLSFHCNIANNVIYQPDGPYVFYRNGEIVVKNIESTGPKTTTYQNASDAVLTCRFPNGVDSFNVELQSQLNIPPSTYALPQNSFATSDIEGNLEAFVMLLTDAGVMDEDYNWTFDDGHLVFIGDMFDRGSNVTECLWLLYRLEAQAVQQGGQVNFIIGNHDISNLTVDFDDTHPKYGQNAVYMGETLESINADDTELGRWLRNKNIVERTGPFIFVHGGISPEIVSLGFTYDQHNDWGRLIMDDVDCSSDPCLTVRELFWDRGMPRELYTQQEVDDAVAAFGGEAVVLGHTVVDDISLLYNEKVIAIDLDHKSNFANGFMKGFYYESGEMFEFFTNGTTQIYTPLGVISNDKNVENPEPKVHIMPNPSNGIYTITMDETDDITNLKIINLQGQILLEKSNLSSDQMTNAIQVDLSDLPQGIYFLQLQNKQYHSGYKLIKE